MKEILNIALVAHDSRKKELIDWVRYNSSLPTLNTRKLSLFSVMRIIAYYHFQKISPRCFADFH